MDPNLDLGADEETRCAAYGYYSVLGVGKDADSEEIKKSYRFVPQ